MAAPDQRRRCPSALPRTPGRRVSGGPRPSGGAADGSAAKLARVPTLYPWSRAVSLHAEWPPLHTLLTPDLGYSSARPWHELCQPRSLRGCGFLLDQRDNGCVLTLGYPHRPASIPQGINIWDWHLGSSLPLRDNLNIGCSGVNRAFHCIPYGSRHCVTSVDCCKKTRLCRLNTRPSRLSPLWPSDHALLVGWVGLKHLAQQETS
jgi:hypothetical protein